MSTDQKALDKLTHDLIKLQEDIRTDMPSMSHHEFSTKYLQLFLGNLKATNHTFHHWYEFTGHRTCFVNITDMVDGKLQVVYQVPPILNRNGLTSIPKTSTQSMQHLLNVAEQRSARLPRRESEFFSTYIGQAHMTNIEPDEEGEAAWAKLLAYNNIVPETTPETTLSENEKEDIVHTSEDISWDEDAW